MKVDKKIINTVLSALFLAIAFVLPFLTGQIQTIGNMLCPMHIPVILCGFICGAPWGALVGAVAPILRSLIMGMPVLFPNAVAMAFELAVYGLCAGLLYRVLPKKKIYIYVSLILSMISGRLVWGMVQFVFLGFSVTEFPFSAFLAGAFTNAVPGIILQLVLIPVLVMVIEKVNKKVID